MVALSACPGRREVVVWASSWRRGRSGNAIRLKKVARQSAVRAQHGPYCSHKEERFSYIWRPLGVPAATIRHVCCDATATCFRGDLTALVLSMFKTWRRPRRPWRPYCDLQRYHGAQWDLTTQRRSAAIWPILQIAARSPSCVTGVLFQSY